jgi:hypothetical protein
MASLHNDTGSRVLFDDGDMFFAVVDHLFDVPLYGWYIILIEQFMEGDIKGVLITCPIEMQGPFETQQDATEAVRSQLNSSSENSQHS